MFYINIIVNWTFTVLQDSFPNRKPSGLLRSLPFFCFCLMHHDIIASIQQLCFSSKYFDIWNLVAYIHIYERTNIMKGCKYRDVDVELSVSSILEYHVCNFNVIYNVILYNLTFKSIGAINCICTRCGL